MTRQRLVWRVFAATAGLTASCVAALAAASWLYSRERVYQHARQDIEVAIGTVAHRCEERLAVVLRSLQDQARTPLLINALIDETSSAQAYLVPLLAGLRSPIDGRQGLAFTDYQGRTIAAHGAPLPAVATTVARDAVAAAAVRVAVSADGGQRQLLMAAPIMYAATGTAEGALVMSLDPQALSARIDVGLPTGCRVELLIGDEARPPIGDGFAAGRPVACDALLADLRPEVRVTRDADAALAPLQELMRWHVLVAVAGLAISGLGSGLISRRIVGRIERLAETARQAGATAGSDAAVPDLGRDEIGELADAMRTMLAEIAQHRTRLEAQVAARTAQLAASEEQARRLALVADRTSNAVVISDAEGRITWVNEAFTRLTGWPLADIAGRKPGSLLQGPATDQATVARIREAVGRRQGVRVEVLNYARDGRTYWIDLDIQPIREADGSHGGFIAVNSDITERRAAAERLRALATRQEALLGTLPDLILVLDGEDRIRDALGATGLLLAPREAVTGSGLAALLPTDLAQRAAAVLGEVRADGTTRSIDYALPISGVPREFHGRVVRVDADETMLVITDVTAQRAMERDLARARDAAEAAARAKSAFLANMSHEIRTPMNGILGLAELLIGSRLEPEQADHARALHRSAEALLAILNDILDLSKIEAERMQLESAAFDPETLALDVIELFRARIPAGIRLALRIDPDVPAALLGDPGRVRQLLANLLGNALKFTRQGHIAIDLRWDGGTLAIAVADTGIGIPADRQPHLFKPFTQADSSTARRFGGTGLGLSICRRLAELMGGRIDLVSTEGVGSTFTVLIPATLAEGAGPTDRPLAGRSILVASTHEAIRAELEAAVRSNGGQSRIAADADEAMRAIALGGIDAAVAELELIGTGTIQLAAVACPLLAVAPASGATAPPGVAGILVRPLPRRQLAKALLAALADVRAGRSRVITRNDLAAADPASATGQPAQPRSGLRVLLAEDNPINRRVATALLARLGAEVGIAEDGAEAIRLAAAGGWDLCLMDCQMPVVDGYEATAAIRAREVGGSYRLPILAMTANAMDGDRERCLAAGMDGHIPKPVTGAALAAALHRWDARAGG